MKKHLSSNLSSKKIKSEALIIDVRNNWEHQELRKLPNSLNIPLLELISEPEKYIKNKNQLIMAAVPVKQLKF